MRCHRICEHERRITQIRCTFRCAGSCIFLFLLGVGFYGFPSSGKAGSPDPLPLAPVPYRVVYRDRELRLIPLDLPARLVSFDPGSGGQSRGPAGVDQVAIAAFDPANNALRVNALLTSGGVHTPTDANQVFTSIYDPVHNAIQINCVVGCGGGGGGSFTAAGDLSGSGTSQTVIGLQTRPVATTVPSTNQVLAWSGSAWTPTTPASGGAGTGACAANQFVTGVNLGSAPTCVQPSFANLSGTIFPVQLPAATGTSLGAMMLTKDLAGSATAPLVAGLQGNPVGPASPSNGQALVWNGSAWTPTTLATGGAVMQVNGTNAASQATINFQSGTNIAVSNPSAGIVAFNLTGTIPVANGGTGLTTVGASGQCLTSTGTALAWGACGSGGGGVSLTPSAAQTIQPTAGSNTTPLAIAPATGTTPTADLFDVWKDSAMTTKAMWVDASGNLNFLGNNATYGAVGQATQSFLRLYGSTVNSNLAPPYLDLEKVDGSVRSYLAPSTSTNGLLCTSSSVPGGDCGPAIASTNFLVSAAGGTAPTTNDCVKWVSSTQIGDSGSACGAGGGAATLQVNGTNTASQSTINFQSGTNITVSNPSVGNVAFNLAGTIPVANGGTGLTTVGASGQCLTSNGTALAWGACGSGGGVSLTPSAAQTIQPTAGSNTTPLAIAPATGTTPTADLFDVWKDSAMTTKAMWVDASGNLNFLGNNSTYGAPNQTTQSFLRLYGSTTGSNLAPPYLDLEKVDGSTKSYLAPSTSTSGLLCTSSSVPGGDCGPTIASTNFLVSATGGTAPTTNDCVKWISSTQIGDSGSACGSGGSGTPGGSSTAVQFNNSGAFGGDATNFLYNSATHSLTVTGTITASSFQTSGAGASYTQWTAGTLPAGSRGTVLCGANTGNIFSCSTNGGTLYPVAFLNDGGDLGGSQGSEQVAGLHLTAEGSAGNQALTTSVANDTTTGTTVNLLAKLTSTGAIKIGTSDTAIPVYPVVSGAGTSGNAHLAQGGQASCVMDATASTTEGQFVQASTTTAGDCHATGSTTAPSSGWVIGQMVSNSTTSGATATISLMRGYNAAVGAGGSGGSVTSVGLSVPAGFAVTNSPVTTSGTLAVTGPLTTEGDLPYFHSSAWARLGVGASGQCLTSNGTDPVWGACASGGTGSPGGSFGQVQFNSSGAFGGESNTVVVQGGSGAIHALTFAAGTKYIVTANDTETAATSISANNVTIECVPGVTIQQTTASTDLFDVTGNNFTIKDCGLSPVASGTAGVLVNTTPATPVNYLRLDHVTLNANSSTATNSSAGWVYITGGSHDYINAVCLSSDENCVTLDNETPSTHDTIDDVIVRGQYFVNADAKGGIYTHNQSLSGITISHLDIDADIQSVGYCIYLSGNGFGAQESSIRGSCKWTGTGSTGGWWFYGCHHCVLGPAHFSDGGSTHTNEALLDLYDSSNTTVTGVSLYMTSGHDSPFKDLDSWNITIDGLTASGDLNNDGTSQNGWDAAKPCLDIRQSATNATVNNVSINNVLCSMPPSSTANGVFIGISGTGNPQANNIRIANSNFIGQSDTAAAIALSNTATGGSQSFARPVINGNVISGFATGISTTSGVTNALIRPQQWNSVTTKWSLASGSSALIDDMSGVTFANLPANVAAGTRLYVSDANSTCTAGSSTGQICEFVNGAWTH